MSALISSYPAGADPNILIESGICPEDCGTPATAPCNFRGKKGHQLQECQVPILSATKQNRPTKACFYTSRCRFHQPQIRCARRNIPRSGRRGGEIPQPTRRSGNKL